MPEQREDLYELEYRGTMRVRRDLDATKLLRLARERALDADSLDEVPPFFFRVGASNNRLDSYFTKMAESSLANYAADGQAGVQFQNSHNGHGGFFGGGGEVGFGRSLDAQLLSSRSDKEVAIDFMTQRGLSCGNLTSDQLILGLRSGIYQDVSIGFSPGRFECSICGLDMLRWDSDCSHYPGVIYEVEKKGRKSKVQAFAWVHDAHLNEVSIVYDGATPGAGVLAVEKARAAAARGRLDARSQQLIEGIYRCPIIGPRRQWLAQEATMSERTEIQADDDPSEEPEHTAAPAATEEPEEGDDPQDDATELEPLEEEAERTAPGTAGDSLAALRTKWADTPIKLGTDPVKALEAVGDAYLDLRGKHAAIRKEATDGRAYRAHLNSELAIEAVRAMGADAWSKAKDRWERTAAGSSCEDLLGFIADFRAQGDTRLGKGKGRATEDTAGTSRTPTPIRVDDHGRDSRANLP